MSPVNPQKCENNIDISAHQLPVTQVNKSTGNEYDPINKSEDTPNSVENSTMSQMTVEGFLDYIEKSKSKNTYKSYRIGIEAFSEWFGKTPNQILKMRQEDFISGDLVKKKRFTHEIEKFHNWLLQPIHYLDGKDKPSRAYTINSARNMCLGIIQLFRYYEMPIAMLSREVSQTVPTTKDFIPTVEQYRAMYKVASDLRAKLIISMGKDLAWRIGDFAQIRKDMLPNLDQDAPISFELITEKEKVIAKSFLSQETVDLLKEYLPTIANKTNPYLFPSNSLGYYDPESINRTLRELAEKSNIKIPKAKRLRFHAFRKRFLTECANLSIDVNTAKILCGKDVEESMLTYLSEVEHREAFIRVHERLRLTETPMRKTRESATELEKRVDKLERMLNIIAGLNPDVVSKADEMLKNLGVTMTAEQFTKMTFTEKLDIIAKEQERRQQEEYKKLIAENNNNNNR